MKKEPIRSTIDKVGRNIVVGYMVKLIEQRNLKPSQFVLKIIGKRNTINYWINIKN